MKARLKVYAPDGSTARTADVGQGAGILPTIDLRFSVEVGGGGGVAFGALYDDLDALSAWDSVVHVELPVGGGFWDPVAAYALRGPWRRPKVGRQQVECVGVPLLEAWASEAVILPEYGGGSISRGAGTDRAVGWQMTAYDPSADANEAWDGCYEASRATMPSESMETGAAWPTGAGAAWISITGATDASERKLFRTAQTSPLEITASSPVRVHAASDSSGTLYIGGEPVLVVDGGEPGKEPIRYQQADLYMAAGEYAVAFDTQSVWDSGGDGVDPIIIAICTLDADGDPDTWLLVTNDTDWVACRRNDEPPGDEPPGPTPGALLEALVGEAADRSASGWAGVTLGFDAAEDYYGNPWPAIVVERLVRYGSDTLWSVFRMLSETLEVDTWLDPDLTLNAAPMEGEDITGSVELTSADIVTMSDTQQPDAGTWVAALALDGWITASSGTPRREYGLELGTAISMPVGTRMVSAALAENGRWDASARLSPSTSSRPFFEFLVGDTIAMDYPGAPASARVLSVSATALDAGLAFDLELTDAES